MKTKLAATAAILLLAIGGAAGAATIAPVSYIFDQATDCGSWCYYDNGNMPTANNVAGPRGPGSELIDGVTGYAGWAVNWGAPWVGWTDNLVHIDFTFAPGQAFNQVSVGTTQDFLYDVVIPNLALFSSDDGNTWTSRGVINTTPSSLNDNNSLSTAPHTWRTFDNLDFSATYVRLDVMRNGASFAFLDEVRFADNTVSAAPEPTAWALTIAGFGLAGAALRRRRAATAA